ncbi:unnamed protein product [Chondrus crispus]|uniref:Uncharacterized protein ycf20 n=1 Tax=Chondrus crispus TaxID=2769 RepID=R7QB40_CHOCR|nr:unnamed protein product [Chondrus crispus]CDF35732.1 unnamed protein product [Chondrus crispus]|eukprot:XP_005715551.1 unnamed protein product [Chondrus crispus]
MCGVPFAAFILSPPIRLKTFHASCPLSPSRPKNAARVGPVMQVKDPSSEDESLPDNDLLSRLNSVPDATRKPGRSQHLVDSPGRIREVYTYFTEQLRPDIEGLLENPFNLISLAFIAILFGFFAATSAATIIGSVADWDPLAAAVLLVWTEGFTKYYYGLKDKSRLLQLINAFKIGLIYGMTVDAFKLST